MRDLLTNITCVAQEEQTTQLSIRALANKLSFERACVGSTSVDCIHGTSEFVFQRQIMTGSGNTVLSFVLRQEMVHILKARLQTRFLLKTNEAACLTLLVYSGTKAMSCPCCRERKMQFSGLTLRTLDSLYIET